MIRESSIVGLSTRRYYRCTPTVVLHVVQARAVPYRSIPPNRYDLLLLMFVHTRYDINQGSICAPPKDLDREPWMPDLVRSDLPGCVDSFLRPRRCFTAYCCTIRGYILGARARTTRGLFFFFSCHAQSRRPVHPAFCLSRHAAPSHILHLFFTFSSGCAHTAARGLFVVVTGFHSHTPHCLRSCHATRPTSHIFVPRDPRTATVSRPVYVRAWGIDHMGFASAPRSSF